MNRRRFLIGSAATGIVGCYVGFPGIGMSAGSAIAGGLYAPTAWYSIDRTGIVTIHVAKAEVGQHIGTAFAMAIAEELEVEWRNIRLDYPDPRRAFGIMVTGGSWSVALNFDDMLRAGAAGRIAFIEAGAKQLGFLPADCFAEAGRVVHERDGRHESVDYARLVAMAAVERVFEDDDLGIVPLKPASAYKLIGKSLSALDIPAKTDGCARFSMDVFAANMLYAKIARPPLRAGCKPRAIDDGAARRIPGYRQFVSVADPMNENGHYVMALADTFPGAQAAAQALEIDWDLGPNLAIDDAAILAHARSLVSDESKGAPWWIVGDAAAAMKGAASVFSAEYTTPMVAHAGLEPMSALVFRDGETWHACAGSAFQTKAVAAVANALDVDSGQVALHQTYIGDPTGRHVETDMLVAAALAAKSSGRPVKLISDRAEDLQFDFHRPATYQKLTAGFDANHRPMALMHDLCSGWPLKRALPIALQPSADRKAKLDFSVLNGADSWYSFPHYRVRGIENDVAQRSSPPGFFRANSTGWVFFALESFVDELANLIGWDAVELRLSLLDGSGPNGGIAPLSTGGASRLASLLRRLVRLSDYDRKRHDKPPGRGVGLAVSSAPDRNQPSWTGCVAEVTVDRRTGALAVEKLTAASDVGTAINPDGVRAQIESAALCGLSVALCEEANLIDGRVVQDNFDSYRMLRFAEVPELEIHVIGEGYHPTGAGEPALSVVAPAIANAIFHAMGARVRALPLTPEKILAALNG